MEPEEPEDDGNDDECLDDGDAVDSDMTLYVPMLLHSMYTLNIKPSACRNVVSVG